MQKYKEINGNDYVKNSRTTINETMQSIQSMNSGTAFPTNNLFEGMKCYRTDLKKTYTLTDVENNTWVEDAHATLSDEATHAASATKLQTARSLNLGGAVKADAATFDGTANATINVKTLDATKLKGTTSVSTTGNAATATKVVATAAAGASANIAEATMASSGSARIRVSGATNAGELALETADDGSEPIVARQYTGAYTNAVRTAKILDESGNTSFPGTVVAPKFTGALNGNAATATKLSAARKINITGNATGAATFDGTSDVSINVSVSQAAHADGATADKYGADIADNYIKHYINVSTQDLNDIRTGGLYAQPLNANATTARHYPENEACSILVIQNGANGVDGCTQICTTFASHNSYKREYDVVSKTWSAWRRYAFEDSTVSSAQKLSTARKINITGNATGSAGFDGTSDVNINVTVNSATKATNDGNGANIASTYVKKAGGTTTGKITFESTDLNALPEVKKTSDDNMSGVRFSSKTKFLGAVGKRLSNGEDLLNLRSDNSSTDIVLDSRNYNNYAPTKTGGGASGTWGISISGTATKVYGMYTGKGGQQGPGYFGTNSAGCLMSNQSVNGHTEFKNWLYMDNYNGTDAGGATAIGVSREETRAYIMSSNADRKQWDRTAELLSSANYNSFAPTKTGGGASGTWGISISGNAASATNATKIVNNGNRNDIANGAKAPSGLSVYQCYANTGYPQRYGNVVSIGGRGDNELFLGWQDDARLLYRSKVDVQNNWTNWRAIAFTDEINNYAPTKTGGGASGTWGININGNAASATNADKLDGYHASDIINRISAANTGGIVAASLTENGYVKFANGLILQWGNASGEREHADGLVDNSTTFPIAFPSTCFTVLLTSKRYAAGILLVSQSKTSFTWEAGGGLVSWVAVGM